MSLRQQQSEFAKALGLLLIFIHHEGYEVTLGDAWAREDEGAHRLGSFHYKRLAIDLNLFKGGEYLTETEDHRRFGEYWVSLGGTWGGDFPQKDGNHYSFGEY